MGTRETMQAAKALAIWFWRAWPVAIMVVVAGLHYWALACFPAQVTTVNKWAGTAMQIVGSLIVLQSVDANLGIFRGQSFAKSILGWFAAFPLFQRRVIASHSSTGNLVGSGSCITCAVRTATTIEERLAEAERQIEEVRAEVRAKHQEALARIDTVKTELATSITANQTEFQRWTQKIEQATVGGFKQQAFGVMLAIYGAGVTLFG